MPSELRPHQIHDSSLSAAASWSAAAKKPEPHGFGDAAVERVKPLFQPSNASQPAKAVSRQGLPPHSTTLTREKKVIRKLDAGIASLEAGKGIPASMAFSILRNNRGSR
jgi:hypothetical protein